jgi:hypothetical protein
MSAIRYHRPPNRLDQLLRVPGGLPVAEALDRAAAGLTELQAPARDALAQAIADAEAAAERLPKGFDAPALGAMYDLAQGAVGLASLCGRPAVDAALKSLCELLDHLRVHRRWDGEAVEVHVRALRLLMGEAGEGDGAEVVLEGLRRVSRKYAGPETG